VVLACRLPSDRPRRAAGRGLEEIIGSKQSGIGSA